VFEEFSLNDFYPLMVFPQFPELSMRAYGSPQWIAASQPDGLCAQLAPCINITLVPSASPPDFNEL